VLTLYPASRTSINLAAGEFGDHQSDAGMFPGDG